MHIIEPEYKMPEIKNYHCRNKSRQSGWSMIAASHPSLAAQIFAEDFGSEHGDRIEVKGHGSFDVEKRVVIHAVEQ